MNYNCITAAIIAGLVFLSQVNGAPHRIPLKHASSEEESFLLPSKVIFDFGTRVLQVGKMVAAIVDGSRNTFELARPYTYDFTRELCSENSSSCEAVQEFITIGGENSGDINPYTTILEGALDNDARVVFDTNNVSYTFTVPEFRLISSDFQRIATNLNTGDMDAYSGLVLTVANTTLGISADFEFQEHYKVSNVKVILNLGEVSMKIPTVAKFENGTWSDLPPIAKDVAQEVMELWRETDENGVTLEKRYSEYVEQQINEVLAGRELNFE